MLGRQSSDLMKRSYSALQSSIPCSPELDDSGVSSMCFAHSSSTLQPSIPCSAELDDSGISFMCFSCSAVVDEPLFSSIQSFAVALFSCCEQAFVIMILVGQSGATLDLSQTWYLPEMQ